MRLLSYLAMTAPAPDSRLDPVRAAIDSTTMLVLARFFMPIVVAILGYFLTGVLDDMKQANHALEHQIQHVSEQQADAQARAAAAVATLNAAVKQLDRLQTQVDSIAKHN